MQVTMMATADACCGTTGATSTATTMTGAMTATMAAATLLHRALLLPVGFSFFTKALLLWKAQDMSWWWQLL